MPWGKLKRYYYFVLIDLDILINEVIRLIHELIDLLIHD